METKSTYFKTMAFIIGILSIFALVSCGGNDAENAEPSFFLTVWHLPWFWATIAAAAFNNIALATAAQDKNNPVPLKLIPRTLALLSSLALSVFVIILFFKLEHWYYALIVGLYIGIWSPVAQSDASKCPAVVSIILSLIGIACTVTTYVLFF